MAIEQTFSIIKPDAVERNLIGDVLKMITDSGLRIKGMKMIHMDRAKA
ncbi:MAG: nucleoside-diphosphate kinase, partial [Pseudomonadota bacterium]